MRPDRIVVGEVRGGEAFHLLQAMNTGHGGALTTAHANTPVDTLRRIESLCLLSGVDLPLRAVRAQVASAVHLVVCCERFADGSRKITHVTEVLPLDEQGEYRAQDLVRFEQSGKADDGRLRGRFVFTGATPSWSGRLAGNGYGDIAFEAGSEEADTPGPQRKIDVAPLPSVQLDPELQREVDERLPNESTLITRNPLTRRDEDTQPGKRRRS